MRYLAVALACMSAACGTLIEDYLLLGPFAAQDASSALATPFVDEARVVPSRGQGWRAVSAPGGTLNLALLGGEFEGATNSAAYAACYVVSPVTQLATLEIMSDDGVAAWVNGAQVHYHDVQRSLGSSVDHAQALLAEGANLLLLKVSQGGGGWALRVGVKAAEPVTVEPEHEDFVYPTLPATLVPAETTVGAPVLSEGTVALPITVTVRNLGGLPSEPVEMEVRLGGFQETIAPSPAVILPGAIAKARFVVPLGSLVPVPTGGMLHLSLEARGPCLAGSDGAQVKSSEVLARLAEGLLLEWTPLEEGGREGEASEQPAPRRWTASLLVPEALAGAPLSLAPPPLGLLVNGEERNPGEAFTAPAPGSTLTIEAVSQAPLRLRFTPPCIEDFLYAEVLLPEAAPELAPFYEQAAGRILTLLARGSGGVEAIVQGILGDLEEKAGRYEVTFVGNSHIDMAWLWPWTETVEVCKSTFRQALAFMEEYPDFCYAQSNAAAYLWMEEYCPGIADAIRERIESGNWEVVGGTWVESDCNIPDGESLVRQHLYGKRYFRERFGVDVRVGWLPDTFGFNWSMPQIMKRSGIDYFMTTKISWNDTNRFPFDTFWWESPDGSRVFAHMPLGGYGSQTHPPDVLRRAKETEARTGAVQSMVLYGVGDHGGGPTRAQIEEISRLARFPAGPRAKMGRALPFFESLEESIGPEAPVHRDELYLEYHRGTYTTQAVTKKNNRESEEALRAAELFCAAAAARGWMAYPREEMLRCWRLVLFNQFHDILAGTSIPRVYEDSQRDYDEVFQRTRAALSAAAEALASRIDTRGEGRPVLILNQLAWARDALLELPAGGTVWGAKGEPLPAQRTGEGLLARVWLPPAGYRVVFVGEGKPAPPAEPVTVRGTTLSNGTVSATVDPRTGLLTSLAHLPSGWEALAAGKPGNLLELQEDRPSVWDAWEIGLGPVTALDGPALDVSVTASGPLLASIRVERAITDASSIVQEYRLAAGSPVLEVRSIVQWHEKHRRLKVAFPASIDPDKAAYEIQYGVIERSTRLATPYEQARFEVPAQRWADLSDGSFGLALINDAKYGHDIHDGVIRLSLLRSPTDPDPHADEGEQRFTYYLCPHTGDWRDAGLVRLGQELNLPPITMPVESHAGSLPPSGSLFGVDGEGVILHTVKFAEDSDALVLRLYETRGRRAKAKVALPVRPRHAWRCNLMEEPGERVACSPDGITLSLEPWEIATVLVAY